MKTDFFMREDDKKGRKEPPRCMSCREVAPLLPIGLGNLGFCAHCVALPSTQWGLDCCPYCHAKGNGGYICEECRAEGTWRLIEAELHRMRTGAFPAGFTPCNGLERKNRRRNQDGQ